MERSKLGPLEKHRHFVARSRQEQEREAKIQQLKKLADDSNPEEFQFFMYQYRQSGNLLIRKDKPGPAGRRDLARSQEPAEAAGTAGAAAVLPQRMVFPE